MRIEKTSRVTKNQATESTTPRLPKDPQRRFAALKKMFEASAGKEAEPISERDVIGWRAGELVADFEKPPIVIPKVLICERRGGELRIAALHDEAAYGQGPDYYRNLTADKSAGLRDGVDQMFRDGLSPIIRSGEIYFVERPGIQHRVRKHGRYLLLKVEGLDAQGRSGPTGFGIFETVVTPKPALKMNRRGDTVITINLGH